MKGNGQRQWNQQHQLALGCTLLVVCSPVAQFVCLYVGGCRMSVRTGGCIGGVYAFDL